VLCSNHTRRNETMATWSTALCRAVMSSGDEPTTTTSSMSMSSTSSTTTMSSQRTVPYVPIVEMTNVHNAETIKKRRRVHRLPKAALTKRAKLKLAKTGGSTNGPKERDPVALEISAASTHPVHAFDPTLIAAHLLPVCMAWRRSAARFDSNLADESERVAISEGWGGGGSGDVFRPIVALLPSSSSSSSSSMKDGNDEEDVVDDPSPDVPLISRTYEERWMRAPNGTDDEDSDCSKKESCQCAILSNNAFSGVVFRYPNGKPSSTGMCLLCIRYEVTRVVLSAALADQPAYRVLQPHRNEIGPNEYSSRAMLIRSSAKFFGITDPFVMYHRLDYIVDTSKKRIRHSSFVDYDPSIEGQRKHQQHDDDHDDDLDENGNFRSATTSEAPVYAVHLPWSHVPLPRELVKFPMESDNGTAPSRLRDPLLTVFSNIVEKDEKDDILHILSTAGDFFTPHVVDAFIGFNFSRVRLVRRLFVVITAHSPSPPTHVLEMAMSDAIPISCRVNKFITFFGVVKKQRETKKRKKTTKKEDQKEDEEEKEEEKEKEEKKEKEKDDDDDDDDDDEQTTTTTTRAKTRNPKTLALHPTSELAELAYVLYGAISGYFSTPLGYPSSRNPSLIVDIFEKFRIGFSRETFLEIARTNVHACLLAMRAYWWFAFRDYFEDEMLDVVRASVTTFEHLCSTSRSLKELDAAAEKTIRKLKNHASRTFFGNDWKTVSKKLAIKSSYPKFGQEIGAFGSSRVFDVRFALALMSSSSSSSSPINEKRFIHAVTRAGYSPRSVDMVLLAFKNSTLAGNGLGVKWNAAIIADHVDARDVKDAKEIISRIVQGSRFIMVRAPRHWCANHEGTQQHYMACTVCGHFRSKVFTSARDEIAARRRKKKKTTIDVNRILLKKCQTRGREDTGIDVFRDRYFCFPRKSTVKVDVTTTKSKSKKKKKKKTVSKTDDDDDDEKNSDDDDDDDIVVVVAENGDGDPVRVRSDLCSRTEITPIRLAGFISTIDDVVLSSCWRCGAPCTFESERLGTNIFECGGCTRSIIRIETCSFCPNWRKVAAATTSRSKKKKKTTTKKTKTKKTKTTTTTTKKRRRDDDDDDVPSATAAGLPLLPMTCIAFSYRFLLNHTGLMPALNDDVFFSMLTTLKR